MGKWEMVRLGDVCDIVSGTTPSTNNPELWDGDIKWIAPAEINDDSHFIFDTMKHISEKAGLKPMPVGTVLLSSRAPIGKVAIAGVEMCCNQGFKNLVCSPRIYNRYLYRYLKGKTEYLNGLGRGATFKEISKPIVEQIEIPLPPVSVQRQIADVLDRASVLIEKRKAQIEKLDLLVKSQFIEMFGNPIRNEKGYPKKQGITFFKLSNGKALPDEKRLDHGIPAYGGNGISWYTDESLCSSDTLVVGRVGFQSGNVHYVKGPLWVTDNAMYISEYTENEYDLIFLFFLMDHVDFTRFQDAGDLKKITQKPFMQMDYIAPPLDIQKTYSAFVQQVEMQKTLLRQSIIKLEQNYKSVMQKSFRGDFF